MLGFMLTHSLLHKTEEGYGSYPGFFFKATATIPATPPRMPGMPCRLWTPQVSWIPILDARMGCRRGINKWVILQRLISSCLVQLGIVPTHTQVLEAKGRDDASNKSDQHGPHRPDLHVSARPHSNATGQGGVLNVHL